MTSPRNNTILIYGDSGRYKTTNVGRFAKYIYETTGRPTRLISADGGGWEPIQDLVEAGVVQALRISESEQPISILRVLWKGFWPSATGADGKWLWTQDGLGDVGAYAVEGLTSIGTLVLRHLAATGRKIGEDVVNPWTEKVDLGGGKTQSETFSAPARAHYNFTQNFILDLLTGFGKLPVSRVLFTAHEGKGQDDFSRETVYGPQAVGKAITTKIPPAVGDLLHFDGVPDAKGVLENRLYFETHPDHYNKTPWPAKVRMSPESVVELKKKYPGGFIPLTMTTGVDTVLRFQDEALTSGASSVAAWKEGVDARRAGDSDAS